MPYSSSHISVNKAKKLASTRGVLLDVRSPVAFRNGSIKGAINITPRQISILNKYEKTTPLIFFGESSTDPVIETMMAYASQLGFFDVYTFGGIDNWNNV